VSDEKNTRRFLQKKRYDKEWNPWRSDWPRIKTIVELAGRNKKVLDIGCYEGTISELVARNSNEVYGVDFSDKALDIAKDKGINVFRADIEKDELAFKDSFFDVIIVAEIIEHIFDMRAFFEKIKRVLKPNGYIILTTPNLATLGRRLLLLFGRNPHIEIVFEHGWAGHIRYFIKSNLFSTLKLYDFHVDLFTSDVVNFNSSGTFFSKGLAKIFPTLGKSLIVKASKA